MKILAITIFASYMFAVQAITMVEVPAILANCGKINGVDAKTVREIALSGKNMTNPSKNLIQHIICCFTDTTVLTSTGDWNVDNIRSILKPQLNDTEINQVIDCAIKKDTLEETALGFWRCAHHIVGPLIPMRPQ